MHYNATRVEIQSFSSSYQYLVLRVQANHQNQLQRSKLQYSLLVCLYTYSWLVEILGSWSNVHACVCCREYWGHIRTSTNSTPSITNSPERDNQSGNSKQVNVPVLWPCFVDSLFPVTHPHPIQATHPTYWINMLWISLTSYKTTPTHALDSYKLDRAAPSIVDNGSLPHKLV